MEVNVISTNDDLNQEAVKYPTLTDSETEWLNNADSISIPMASLKQFSEEGMEQPTEADEMRIYLSENSVCFFLILMVLHTLFIHPNRMSESPSC